VTWLADSELIAGRDEIWQIIFFAVDVADAEVDVDDGFGRSLQSVEDTWTNRDLPLLQRSGAVLRRAKINSYADNGLHMTSTLE
jgi:hypothetical protein